MQTEIEQVKAAFAAYFAALNSLDMARIEPLWAHDDTVTQVEPNSTGVTVGWEAVRKNLESFFGGFEELNGTVAAGPFVQVVGDVAWTTSITPARPKTKTGEVLAFNVCTTQVFERRAGAWLVRSNIALPISK